MEASPTVTPTRHQFRAATAARRAGARSALPAAEDPTAFAEPEPSMKLSRAIAVVLLLHVVAVGGVLAFGLIKPPPKPGASEAARPAAPVVVDPSATRAPAVLASKPALRSPMTVGPRASAASVQEAPAVPVAARAAAPAQDDALRLIEGAGLLPTSAAKPGRAEEIGGRSYIVARGDTPFSIAKRNGVSEAALLRANSIDDPRKLQVGQRLVIPSR